MMPSNTKEREQAKFRDASGDLSKVAVIIEQDASSPIPVYLTDSVAEQNVLEFDEITNVASNVLSDVLVYTVPVGKKLRLKSISFNGDNVAQFYVLVDNVIKEKVRIWHTDFSKESIYDLSFNAGVELKIRVEHNRPFVGAFCSTIKGELI